MNTALRFQPWEDVDLPPVPENENYGLDFPSELNQLMKELICFKLGRSKKSAFRETRFMHLMNIIRMLWDNETVRLYSFHNGVRIWDTYTLNVLYHLCNGDDWALTGPASAAKTYASSIYGLVCFYSSPDNTTCLISTTSSSGAERRVWGKIKILHTKTRFAEWFPQIGKDPPSIGKVFDYLKCITFNPNAEILGERATIKNLSNGVIVIPIARDSTGENAIETIMGTKGTYVIWIVDEMPAMMHGIMRPRSNLIHNPFFQFIALGNANDKTDPHGLACTPLHKDEWESIDPNVDRIWKAKTVNVLFLHGEESPNDHPSINHSEILEANEYPFPYLSNKISRNDTAVFEGNGDPEEGKKTIGYHRFCIGFWAGDDVRDTILSPSFVRRYRANEDPLPWGPMGYITYWALDPAYTSGGDDNALFYIMVGHDINGQHQVVFPYSSLVIKPLASSKEDYRLAVAKQVLEKNKNWGARERNGCMDAMADGSLLYREFVALTGNHDITPLSSMGKSNNPRYKNLVTEYWFSVQELIATGYCRGFNLGSLYARDLFMRKYRQEGKTVCVETKDKMKERLRRSPDHGDAASYCCHLVKTRVSFRIREQYKEENPAIARLYVNNQDEEEGQYSHTAVGYGEFLS